MLKKKYNKCLLAILSAVSLAAGSSIVSFAATEGYSGNVSKYVDFESGYLKKANTSSKATNNATKKPDGSFACWVETTTGSNCTYSTSYSSTGKYHMSYKQNFDSDDTCAEILYNNQYRLKLNISTVLVNFTGGAVAGTWSPDNF